MPINLLFHSIISEGDKTMEATKQIDSIHFTNQDTYMNDAQLAYFKNRLIREKMAMIERTEQNKSKFKFTHVSHSDIVDKSNALIEFEHDIRVQEITTDRIKQIDAALKRIEDGSFGYCELTGEEIGLKRLEALPFTNLSVKSLEELEKNSHAFDTRN